MEQFGIALFGATAVILSQDDRKSWSRWACIFGMIGQPFWFLATYKAGQWGMFALCFLYLFGWARGVWNNWIRKS
jgi:hypothetical protein